MGYFTGNWREVSAFADWNAQVAAWVEKYQIYEFVASDAGLDSNGKLQKIDENLIWTCSIGDDELILPEFSEGDAFRNSVVGWFLARLPWEPGADDIPYRLIINCTECFIEEDDCSSGCEVCHFDGKLFLDLEELDAIDRLNL